LTVAFIDEIGSFGRGLYFVDDASYEVGPANDKLVNDYRSTFGEPPKYPNYGHIYDATTLLVLTIRAAMSPKQKNTLTFARQRLRYILSQTKNFKGITGTLSCDSNGNCGVYRFKILRLDDPSLGLEGLQQNVVFIYSSN